MHTAIKITLGIILVSLLASVVFGRSTALCHAELPDAYEKNVLGVQNCPTMQYQAVIPPATGTANIRIEEVNAPSTLNVNEDNDITTKITNFGTSDQDGYLQIICTDQENPLQTWTSIVSNQTPVAARLSALVNTTVPKNTATTITLQEGKIYECKVNLYDAPVPASENLQDTEKIFIATFAKNANEVQVPEINEYFVTVIVVTVLGIILYHPKE